jgi:hypothetical protein
VQVDPIKSTLKPPGTKRLNLQYDEPLSNFAFKFNLCRYTVAENRLSDIKRRMKRLNQVP